MSRLIIMLFIFIQLNGIAQQTLYINNDAVLYLKNKINTTNAVLHINGNIINNDGNLVNDSSLIEIKGNWTNQVSTNAYQSTGIERFTGSNDQQLQGTWNGTSLNRNQLNNVEIHKTSAAGQFVSLGTHVHVNASGSLKFTDSYGIIRTDISSHGSNGAAYPYYLYLQNPAPSALSGNSWTNVDKWSNNGGATTKYIEGKLKRAVSGNQAYDFPVGVAANALDGLEGVSVSFTDAFSATALLAYIQPAANLSYSSDLITNGGSLFYDIGGLPATPPSNYFSNCVSAADGRNDLAVIDNAISHEWIITADAATSNYELSVHPGPVLDNLPYVQMGTPCNSIYPKAKYLARNGRIGGDEAVGPTTDSNIPGVTGFYQKPTGNSLSAQASFSRFRIFGVINPDNTSLPIELTSLTATPINNTLIRVNWTTASELNNRGFVIERSVNGINFDSIGWVNGNGTSSVPHAYFLDDLDVQRGILYYYRLKQIDNNGSYYYSYIVSAKIDITSFIDDNGKTEEILVLSNPFDVQAGLQLTPYYNNTYQILVFDNLGKLLEQRNIQIKASEVTTIQVGEQHWSSGMYLVKITNKSEQSTFIKLIKK